MRLSLAYCAIALLSLVHAAEDVKTRLGNHTIDRTVQLRTHSVYAPYIDADLQNRWWDFGADSYVNTNKHIRLTRPVPSQMGWLWSRLPLSATNYVIEVEFKISGESTHLFGDGLAVWITRTRAEPGPVFGSRDKFDGLGIFLDTYANARHPYNFPRITAMHGDGKTEYDYGNDGEKNSIGACSANFRRTNVATKLKITYLKDTFLDVKIQHKAWDEWSDCFTINGISLPTSPYLGFSAMTGDVFDAHDIITVTTYSAILSASDEPPNKIRSSFFKSPLSTGSSSEAGGGSWLGLLFKLALLAGVAAGALKAYRHFGGRRVDFGGMGGYGGRNGFGGMFQDGKRF
jgi:mannose-binding lectin 2